ncbi:MAG: hypothetical protein AB7K24_02480 [Gemmataceae bacterium]
MSIRFLGRELIGWLLVGFGLLGLYGGFALVMNRRPLEAGPITFMAFLLFNVGIVVLRTATAARLTMHVHALDHGVSEQVLPVFDPWVIRGIGVAVALVSVALTLGAWQRTAVTGQFSTWHVFLPGFAVIGVGLVFFPRTYQDRPLWDLPGEWQLIAGFVAMVVVGNWLVLQSVVNLIQ